MPIEHLPERYKPAARRARDWCLGFGPLLVALGFYGVARGVAYLPITPPIERAAHPVETLAPVTLWGWVWIGASIFALAATLAEQRLSAWAVGIMVGLNGAWWFSYTVDAVLEGHWLNIVPASMHLTLAVIPLWAVWRGARERQPTRKEVADELRRA